MLKASFNTKLPLHDLCVPGHFVVGLVCSWSPVSEKAQAFPV